MDRLITIEKSADQGLIDFLTFLLGNEKVSAIFTLRKASKEGSFDYGLITDGEQLKDAVPLYPLMPASGGQLLSRFTPMEKPVAAVIKPCELHSFIELVKRSQAVLDNFLLISYSCGGALPFKTVVEKNVEKVLPDYWNAASEGAIYDQVRPTCKSCEYFVPMNADITVSLVGEKDLKTECRMFLSTEKAKGFAEGFEGKITEEEMSSPKIESLLEKRKSEKEKLFSEVGPKVTGLDQMIRIFGRCIGCHNCGHVCPICHCILCDYESNLFDYDLRLFERESVKRGALRLPPDTILYQIGRMTHMSFSCVGCGLCTEACPSNIPVSAIFLRTGEETAKIFDYVPGRDWEEPVPVMVFKEEELSELGE